MEWVGRVAVSVDIFATPLRQPKLHRQLERDKQGENGTATPLKAPQLLLGLRSRNIPCRDLPNGGYSDLTGLTSAHNTPVISLRIARMSSTSGCGECPECIRALSAFHRVEFLTADCRSRKRFSVLVLSPSIYQFLLATRYITLSENMHR